MYTYYAIKRAITVFFFMILCLQSCKPSTASLTNLAQNPLQEEGAAATSLDLQEEEKEASQEVAEAEQAMIVASLLTEDIGVGQGHEHQIHTALETAHVRVEMNLLDNHDAPANSRTVAHIAAEEGNMQTLHQLILQDDFDINMQDSNGNTVLHSLVTMKRSRNWATVSALNRVHMFISTMHYIVKKQEDMLVKLKENLGDCYPELLTYDVTENIILPIVVDYLIGVDLSLINQDGETVGQILADTLLRASRAGIKAKTSEEVGSILKKHKSIGCWVHLAPLQR